MKKITQIGKCASIFLLLSGYQLSAQDVTVTVSTTDKQAIEGIGGGIVYYQNWFTVHKNKKAIYDTIFTGLGLSALRIGNWAQESTANLSNDAEIVKEAKQRLGSSCFVEMSSWSAPASLKANGSVSGTKGGAVKASLKKENGAFVYSKFGEWWKTSLEQYHAVGIYPDYISIQNEPDMDADYEATLFNPTESTDIASYGKALAAVSSAISGMANKPKIIGPEPLGIGWNTTQNYVNALDKSLLYAYCFHYYHSGVQTHTEAERYSYPDDFKTAMSGLATALSDKPMFMTENCSMRARQDNDAVYIAWIMANAFNINKVSAYIHWNLLWGDTGGGCINVGNPWNESSWTNTQGFTVNCEYHGLRHFSKFIKKGWICIGVSTSNTDVVTAAFKSPAGDAYTIVMINKGTSAHTASMSLPSGASAMNGTLVQTVPASNVWSKTIGAYKSGGMVSLPAYSVTTLALVTANASPIVAITAPATGAKISATSALALTATATDADGSIAKVEFYDGTTLVGTGTVSGSTYSLSVKDLAAGTHSITAKATDNAGNVTTSAAIDIKILPAQAPYLGTAWPIPGTIQFEHFDVGGNGFAYLDNTAGSAVTPAVNFRTDEDVDIEICKDTDGGYNVGYMTAGEWMEYTVNVAAPGNYNIDLRVACNADARTLALEIGGKVVSASIAIPNTAGWQMYQTVTLTNVPLAAGEQLMKITMGTMQYVNLNYVTFTAIPVAQTQNIALVKGWNLISTNVHPADSTIATLFNDLDVLEIKDMNSYWRKDQPAFLNLLQTITAGNGYLVNMNAEGTLSITGTPVQTQNFASLPAGWSLIGCPYQTATPMAGILGSNFLEVKDFEGFMLPNGTSNSIQNFEPGKGFFIKK